jgi:hypothetical protein
MGGSASIWKSSFHPISRHNSGRFSSQLEKKTTTSFHQTIVSIDSWYQWRGALGPGFCLSEPNQKVERDTSVISDPC